MYIVHTYIHIHPSYHTRYANARVARKLGFGVYPTNEPRMHPDRVVAAVESLLADNGEARRSDMAAAARRMHPLLVAAGGVPKAVQVIVEAAATTATVERQ